MIASLSPIKPAVLDTEDIRAKFPVFEEHPDLLFFDNAATTQKPASVIAEMTNFYQYQCANPGRGTYSWATRLESRIEESRLRSAQLINAHPDDIAFTGGATDSLNIPATAWGLRNLKDGDEIMLCLDDHQSAILPWVNLSHTLAGFGIRIKIVPFVMHQSGTYDRKSLRDGLSERTRLVAITHVHHLYGMEMDLPEILAILPDNTLISLDASQSIGHTPIDVKTLGVHFLSFSAHKMFGGTGTGVIWVHPALRSRLHPMRVGAKSAWREEAGSLEFDRSRLCRILECGTQNLAGILSLSPAIEFINRIGMSNVERQLSALTGHLHHQLKTVPGLEFAPGVGQCGCTKGYGIIAFWLDGIAPADLSAYLDSRGIFVRAGNHCLASSNGDQDYVRVSLHVYNSFREIDQFVEVLKDACN